MFKTLFNKKKSRDFRFVNPESYAKSHSFNVNNTYKKEEDAFIRVEQEESVNLNDGQTFSFLERIKHATSEVVLEEIVVEAPSNDEIIELGLPHHQSESKPNVYGFDFDKVSSRDLKQLSGLGVFSDSKIYSALIHSVLSDYYLNIQHFNHPSTFKPSNYKLFDSISAWIIFLSDENDCDFLDLFLDRYVDKPTLFLFSKLNKDASIKRINQFIQQHRLNVPISEIVLHEMES